MLTDKDLKEIFGLSSEQLCNERKLLAIFDKKGERVARYVLSEMYHEKEITFDEYIQLTIALNSHKRYVETVG